MEAAACGWVCFGVSAGRKEGGARTTRGEHQGREYKLYYTPGASDDYNRYR